MNNQPDNRLLGAYRNYQHNNIPFTNNPLLRNNPAFISGVNYSNSQLMMQTRRMQDNQMERLKKIQETRKIEKLNALNQMKDKKKLAEIVIKPVSIEKHNEDVMPEFNKLNKNLEAEIKLDPKKKGSGDTVLEKAWKKRTNKPYKNVLKNVLTDDDYVKKKYNDKEDLVIHRVSDADKMGLEEEFKEFEKELERHDDELKIIYSLSEKANHKKKFEYNKVYKSRIKEDPSSHTELKDSKLEEFKREQKRLDKDNKQYDKIVEILLNEDIFTKEELDEIKREENEDNKILKELGDVVDNTVSKVDKIEKELQDYKKMSKSEKSSSAKKRKSKRHHVHGHSEKTVSASRTSKDITVNVSDNKKFDVDKLDDDALIEIDIDELIN